MIQHARLIEQAAAFQTAHDDERLAALFEEDGVFEDVPFAAIATGHAQMRQFWTATWAALPDFRMDLVSVIVDDHRGAAEWVMSATHEGDFEGNPATGKPFRLRAAAVATFRAGRIVHWTDYWSLADFRKQVGLDNS